MQINNYRNKKLRELGLISDNKTNYLNCKNNNNNKKELYTKKILNEAQLKNKENKINSVYLFLIIGVMFISCVSFLVVKDYMVFLLLSLIPIIMIKGNKVNNIIKTHDTDFKYYYEELIKLKTKEIDIYLLIKENLEKIEENIIFLIKNEISIEDMFFIKSTIEKDLPNLIKYYEKEDENTIKLIEITSKLNNKIEKIKQNYIINKDQYRVSIKKIEEKIK